MNIIIPQLCLSKIITKVKSDTYLEETYSNYNRITLHILIDCWCPSYITHNVFINL